ncbi:MAG: hypothetical protein LBL27_02675 [Coriobacteriales bacterium]|jgi:hypothetical protein|nr:hypothetical protein [Coriobacteriales bacterium]
MNSTTIPSFIPRVLIPLVFVILTLMCVLFALGVIRPPTVEVTDLHDFEDNIYAGEMRPDTEEFVGPVRVWFATGDIYEGIMADGRFAGQGTFIDSDGWTFSGAFTQGRLSGEGSYEDSKGRYEGPFKNSLPEGEGVYHSTEGWSYTGTFKQGSLTDEGTFKFSDEE